MNISGPLLSRRTSRLWLILTTLVVIGALLLVGEGVAIKALGVASGFLFLILLKIVLELYVSERDSSILLNRLNKEIRRLSTDLTAAIVSVRERTETSSAEVNAAVQQLERRSVEFDLRVDGLAAETALLTEHVRPTRRHIIHSGVTLRELGLRDALDSLSTRAADQSKS